MSVGRLVRHVITALECVAVTRISPKVSLVGLAVVAWATMVSTAKKSNEAVMDMLIFLFIFS